MNTDNTTHSPNIGWQILGELELPVGASVEDALYAWLTEVIQPLNLQTELLNKILASAQDAVARAIQAKIMHKFEHIHLLVFVPSEREAKAQAWSFFRLEKIEDVKKEGQSGGDHTIEFYLYREGD